VPWWLPDTDLCEADEGELSFRRDTTRRGRAECQIAMHVVGQFDRRLNLGLVALRCERRGAQLVPMTLSIPEDTLMLATSDLPQKYWWLGGAKEEDEDGA